MPVARGTSMRIPTKGQFSAPGQINIGTAAFCVNPITGLGVGNAMSMGKLAAQLIQQYADQPDFADRVAKVYSRTARRKFRRIFFTNALVNFFHRHFLKIEPLLSFLLRTKWVQRLLRRNDLLNRPSDRQPATSGTSKLVALSSEK